MANLEVKVESNIDEVLHIVEKLRQALVELNVLTSNGIKFDIKVGESQKMETEKANDKLRNAIENY